MGPSSLSTQNIFIELASGLAWVHPDTLKVQELDFEVVLAFIHNLGQVLFASGAFYLRRGTSTQVYMSILSPSFLPFFLPSFLPFKRLKEASRAQRSTGT